jgi:KamA family protein
MATDSTIAVKLFQEEDFCAPPRLKVYNARQLDNIPQVAMLSEEMRFEMKVVSSVLPFRVNEYVIEELIDWDNVPLDPIFQLSFPQRKMLAAEDFNTVARALNEQMPKAAFDELIKRIRRSLNPHPADQLEKNIPTLNGEPVVGVQHKYSQTVLFFPSQGQTCHSYCTFCFRWAQFVGDNELKIAAKESQTLQSYLKQHLEVTDVLFTGGDPMVMQTRKLKAYIEPLLSEELKHIRTIRIGSKALSFWPFRFVTDKDAKELLDLFSRVVESGKHLTFMAHYNHWRELETNIAREAIRSIQQTGAVIRSQGPLLNHINHRAEDWTRLWQTQVELGIVPYYMFVERDTGANLYFEVPLAKAWEVFRHAIQGVSGIGRTVRGPSMSTTYGKVEVQGVCEVQGEKVFVLRFIQGRDADWVQRPFFARYCEKATWFDDLKPAFGERKFFFES